MSKKIIKEGLQVYGENIKWVIKEDHLNKETKFETYFNLYDLFERVLDDEVFLIAVAYTRLCFDDNWEGIKNTIDIIYFDLCFIVEKGKEIIENYERYKDWDEDILNEKIALLEYKRDVANGEVEVANEDYEQKLLVLESKEEEWISFLLSFDVLSEGLQSFERLKNSICKEELVEYLNRMGIQCSLNNSNENENRWRGKYLHEVMGEIEVKKEALSNEYVKVRFKQFYE